MGTPVSTHSKQLALFGATAALTLAMAFGAGYAVHALSQPGPRTADLVLLSQAKDLVTDHYVGDLPDDVALEYGMIRGMLQTLNDPHSVFIEPSAHELETGNLQGEYGGVGLSVDRDEAGHLLLFPLPDSPAARAGVQAGDRLLGVDELIVTETTRVDELTAMVRGPVGTSVTLVVERNGTRLEFSIQRERVEIPSVTWRIAADHPDVGIATIAWFSDRTPDELEHALAELRDQGASSVVLDLRDNGGGLLDSAVRVASIFLDGGPVVIEVRRGEPERTYSAPGRGTAVELPLAILINGNTASAAEVVAGVLSERGRGPLVGQPTYGKGSVQLIFELADGSSLHITGARWYTPSRQPLDGVGLMPTIEVRPADDDSDPVLRRAIEYLSSAG